MHHLFGDIAILADSDVPANPEVSSSTGLQLQFGGGTLETIAGRGCESMRRIFAPGIAIGRMLHAAESCVGKTFYANLVIAVARTIEDRLLGDVWPEPAHVKALPSRPHRRADRAARLAIEAIGRSERQTVSGCKKAGRSVHKHNSLVEAARQKRYLLAQRRLYAGCWSFWLVPDDSRMVGKTGTSGPSTASRSTKLRGPHRRPP